MKKETKPAQILAVSIDDHETLKKLVQTLKERFQGEFDFPMLHDVGRKVMDRYGIFNPHGKGWPHPATHVIDGEGTVGWRFVEVDHTQRPTNKEISAALRMLR